MKSGSTELSERYNFKEHGTFNGNETITAHTLPTVARLSNLVIECTLRYYGGALSDVTAYLEYAIPKLLLLAVLEIRYILSLVARGKKLMPSR